MIIPKLTATKKGVASLYIVIFATILFGVITLSFIRIILSESRQTSNDDLSQSAYDSAMAGVEDAKIAVNRYYQCRTNPSQSGCSQLASRHLFGGNCDTFYLRSYLGYDGSGEVKIQEGSQLGNGSTYTSDQAYTCVILSNVVSDYRSTLTSDTRTRVVPIGIGATKLSDVKTIRFRWYSSVNGTEFRNLDHQGYFAPLNNHTTPPTISLSLIKTGAQFNLKDYNNSTGPDQSTVILLPSTADNAVNDISQATLNKAANSDDDNSPFQIKCKKGEEFACSVALTDLNFASGGNAMLIISMPYGDLITDFAVTLEKQDGSSIDFENVQVSVDSTGRANQLLRRVETRLDPADLFFPYPQYEIELIGTDEESLLKYFWITQNCWTEKGTCDNNGRL